MIIYDYIPNWFISFCFSFLMLYEIFCADVFFNVEQRSANPVEHLANAALKPVHYLFVGQSVTTEDQKHYSFQQTYDYRKDFWKRTIHAIFSLPEGIFFGSVLKATVYLSPEVRKQHRAIIASRDALDIKSNLDLYQKMGIDTTDYRKASKHYATHSRRPGSESHMAEMQQAFKEVVRAFNQHQIIFWVDCGTCLGAYRHGGIIPWDGDIDVGILLPDFQNAKRALQKELDPKKYFVSNPSGRSFPCSYLRVFVRSTGEMIDIYHFEIFPEKQSIKYLLSLRENIFLPTCWRIRQDPFTHLTPFSQVFPLARADFDGVEVPIPRDAVSYLQARYGENIEPAKIYNPITDAYEKDLTHPYWQRSFAH